MKIMKTLLATGALVVAAGAANAATEDWITGDSQCMVDDISPSAVDCVGFFDVTNDSTNVDKAKDGFIDVNLDSFDGVDGLFGYTDWVFVDKFEGATESGEGYRGDGAFTLSDMLNGKYGQIALGFKQGGANAPDSELQVLGDQGGSEWAGYLYNSPFPEMGSYNLARFTNTGLSHMTIWGRGEPVICEGPDCGGGHTPIPLPAAGWLLLGGLGGLAAMRRRNKV